MKAVVQRVKKAKVEVKSDIVGKINKGLLVFIGFHKEDTKKDLQYIADKIINLRTPIKFNIEKNKPAIK